MIKIDKIDREFIIKSLTDKQKKDIEIDYFLKWFIERNNRRTLKECLSKFHKILSSSGVKLKPRNLLCRYYNMKDKNQIRGRYS